MRGFGGLFLAVIIAVSIAYALRNAKKDDQQSTPLPDRAYTQATFDTVAWESEAAAVARGRDVYAWVCAKCHGAAGIGDGGAVINGDTVHPPSFQAPGWRFASNDQALWQRIYLGNNRGMPHWGEQGLQPRDIIAVGLFIQRELRKDVR